MVEQLFNQQGKRNLNPGFNLHLSPSNSNNGPPPDYNEPLRHMVLHQATAASPSPTIPPTPTIPNTTPAGISLLTGPPYGSAPSPVEEEGTGKSVPQQEPSELTNSADQQDTPVLTVALASLAKQTPDESK